MADVYVNALTTITTEPTSTDSVVCVNRSTNEGKIIDYELLAEAILAKLPDQTYSGLNTTATGIVSAINEHESDLTSVASSISTLNSNLGDLTLTAYTLAAGSSMTITGAQARGIIIASLYNAGYHFLGVLGTNTSGTSVAISSVLASTNIVVSNNTITNNGSMATYVYILLVYGTVTVS